MARSWLFRILAALVAFAVVAIAAIALAGNFTSMDAAVNTFPLVTAVALAGAAAAYAAVEYGQTGRLDSLASEFDTRTLVLMPLAIATNIVLGAAVANALKIPIYLDSIGTILVGVLAGPIAGAATGFLTNVLWQYIVPPPLQGSVAAAFSLTAAVIGLLAGVAGRLGVMRPRPARPTPQLLAAGAIAVAVVGGLGWFAYSRFYEETFDPLNAEAQGTLLAVLGWLAAAVILAAVAGLFALLLIRRDLTVAYVVGAGAVTGVIAALISAPVAAGRR